MSNNVFLPTGSGQTIVWTNTALWSTGTVPNAPDANIFFVPILLAQSNQAYQFDIDVPPAQTFNVGSVELAQNGLNFEGNLTSSGAFTIDQGAGLAMQGGSLSAGSLLINATPPSQSGVVAITGYGTVVSAGAIVNHGEIFSNQTKALSISGATFLNEGLILVDGGNLTVTATKAGGGLNLVGSTLVGGTYSVAGGTLDLSLGGTVTTDAATLNLSYGKQSANVLAFYNPTSKSFVPIESSLTTIAPSGVLSIATDSYTTTNSLTVDGQMLMQYGANVTVGGLTIATSGVLSSSNSAGTGFLDTLTANSGTIINNGVINDLAVGGTFGGGDLVINGDISGTGSILIGAGQPYTNGPGSGVTPAILELNGAVSQTVTFADGTGTLILDQPQKFTGTLTFGGSGDKIDLPGLSLSSITGTTYTGTSNGGTLTIGTASGAIALNIVGNYNLGDFSLTAGPQQLVTSPASVILTETVPAGPTLSTAAQAVQSYQIGNPAAPVQIADTARNIANQLDSLEQIAAAGFLKSITLTDAGIPGMVVTTAQATNDAAVLADITGNYTLYVDDYGLTAAGAISLAAQSSHYGAFYISDSAANVVANLDGLQKLAAAGIYLNIILTGSPLLTVTEAQLIADQAVLSPISAGSLNVIGVAAADAFAIASMSHVTSVSVSDSAADVAASLDALQSLSMVGLLGTVTLTDSGTPVLDLTAAQQAADSGALAKIGGSYSIVTIIQPATTVGANVAIGEFQAGVLPSALTISDTAAHLSADLDSLSQMAAAGKITAIQITDSGTLAVTPVQMLADGAALNEISNNFTLAIDGSGANLTVAGLANHGNLVSFSGNAALYTVTPLGNGLGFTVTDNGTGRSSTDSFSGIQALQFADHTEIVAATPSATGVTSGNVTELYSAVFARLPDLPGLAYYENVMAANPTLPITVYAEWFLQSPEYVGNNAHTYAQTAAGDTQFIQDTYQNLLHRTPEASGLAFYQNLIAVITNGTPPGTAAYTASLLLAHASILADFSASPEFLQDVQVTAQHPADSTHWLVLI